MRKNEKLLLGLAFVVTLGIAAFVFYQMLIDVDPAADADVRAAEIAKEKGAQAPPLERLAPQPSEKVDDGSDPALDMPELFGSVRGRVLDPEGNGIAGASVTIRYSPSPLLGNAPSISGSRAYRAKTNEKGDYRLPSLPSEDSYQLRVLHPDFARAEITGISIPGDEEVQLADVTMVPGVRIYGLVYDEAGQGIPEARVWLIGLGFSGAAEHADAAKNEGSLREVLTDKEGQFEFRNAQRSVYSIDVAAEGYAQTQYNNLNLMGTTELLDKEVNFELGSGVSIEGRVVGSDGRAIAEAQIKAHGLKSQSYTSKSDTVSDDAGFYKLAGLQDAIYVVRAEAEGYSPFTHARVKAGLSGIDFTLTPRGSIRGVVVGPTGAPVGRFGIRIEKKNRQNFAMIKKHPQQDHPEGKFLINDLEPGNYRVAILSPDFAWGFSDPFPIRAGQETDSIYIQLSLGGTLSGRVVDANGDPIRGAQIALRNPEDGPNVLANFLRGMIDQHKFRADVRSNESGRFRFEHITEGEYKFEIRHPKFSTEWIDGLAVTEGSETKREVILRPGAIIKGIAQSPDGGPLQNGMIFVQNVAAGVSRQTRSDNNGNFSVFNLPPGEYTVSKSRDTNNPFSAALESADTRKTIRVGPGDVIDLGVW